MALTQSDYDALVNYDRETGHLVKYDRNNGQVDGRSIDLLREQGTIQRLLDNELIYPGGKLTHRGLDEANRLERLRIAQPKANGGAPGAEPLEKKAMEAKLLQTTDVYSPSVGEYPDEPPAVKPVREATPATSPPPLKPSPAAAVPHAIPKSPVAPAKHIFAVESLVAKSEHVPGDFPGSIAYSEDALDPKLVALNSPHSYEAEQFKILRTNLLFPVAGDPPRSILLTSTAPEEGKTFAAANLAISIALNVNKHVLLIDADLRSPQLHRRFGFRNVPGLSNYLADGRPLPSLLLKTKVDKLTLLPSGPPPENPSELISSERMANLLAEVTARYSDRLIVIDAPPPRMAAETGVLSRQVDGILIVVRYGRTRREDLSDLIERVGKKKILGSLVNYAETPESRYYGYKYGGYRKRKMWATSD
jgi:exopolysaccharide/PEP-CTERM locus tyrosine autokinase